MLVLQGEFRLAVPTVLKPGHNIFVSDADTVYLLVKTAERPDSAVRDVPTALGGLLKTTYHEFDNKVRTLKLGAKVRNSHAPRLFWMTKSERISGVRYDNRIFAAFYMTKGPAHVD
ncbi:MAG: hypothetical protein IPI39_26190 [Candidatus Obscuribacter sp.]|nr:hypothetical protein [Candidatus Obscuribacter sp.]